jgi:signal transduction histidine kinase
VCDEVACAGPNRLTPDGARALADLGLSPDFYAAYLLALEVGYAALCFALGALIVLRRPAGRMALFVACFLVTLGAVASGILETVAAAHPAWTVAVHGMRSLYWTALFLFFFLFPDGRFVPRWTGPLAAATIALNALREFFPALSGVEPWASLLGLPLLLGLLGAGVFAQVHRYRRVSGPTQRQQTKWVVFGLTVALGASIPLFRFSGPPGSLPELARLTAVYLAALPIPLSIAVAILRYRLFDIDLLINRTLVYGALSACVVALYVLVVGYLGAVLRTERNLLVSLVGAGLVAVLFQPLRGRLQRGVNRLMYGERDEPYAVLARLGGRLEAVLAPEAVLPTIVQTVREALKLPYAAIALEEEGHLAIAAAAGAPQGEPLAVPLVYQGEPVGRLLVSPRAPGEAWSPADRRLLDDLAHHAGVAVHGVRLTRDLKRLTADLQRSRERLVLAREEERRRLRRDLHDDLAPTLASLGLTAVTAADLIPTDPAAAGDLVRELHAAIRAAVGDIRRLVYDLRPPTLDELGLVAAVRERAEQYSGHRGHGRAGGEPASPDGLEVTVEAPRCLPPLPAAVEVAAYRIVQEALMNVSRHARARTCVVRLALAETDGGARQLLVEVTDDGVGLPAVEGRRAGVGLRSMRERATELGGDCAIEQLAPAGTRVAARLPLAESGGRVVG